MTGAVLGVLLAFASLPLAAGDWGRYENSRFGFAIDVPPRFVAQGESANGDGDRFTTPTAELRAFAGYLVEKSFESEAATGREAWGEDGYAITYQVTTPRNAVFSGRKGARVLYERLVAMCGGDAFMGYSLEYSVADMKAFAPVIDRLSASMKAPASC